MGLGWEMECVFNEMFGSLRREDPIVLKCAVGFLPTKHQAGPHRLLSDRASPTVR